MLQTLGCQVILTGYLWPMQVAEISRVLKPGGTLVASTFLKASAPLGQLFDNDDLFRPLNAVSNHPWTVFASYFLTQDLSLSCGSPHGQILTILLLPAA